MSLGEIVLLLLVGIVVVGPRNLPSMMRTAGQWIARLKRMTTDLRSQSGIDDILRHEGLDEHIHQLRSLSRLNVVESLMAPSAAPPITNAGAGTAAAAAAAAASPYAAMTAPYAAAAAALSGPAASGPPRTAQQLEWERDAPLRMREYPLIGCDAYGALPDDAVTYRMMAASSAIAPAEGAAPAPEADAPSDAVANAPVEAAAEGAAS